MYYYCDVVKFPDGNWIKCDKVTIGPKGKKETFEMRDFLIDGAAPMSLTLTLGILFQGVVKLVKINWPPWPLGPIVGCRET